MEGSKSESVESQKAKYCDMSKTHSQLQTQQNECEMVLDELQRLDESATIYKTTGPILSTQSKSDAVATITKRLEYIKAQLSTVEQQLQKLAQQMNLS
ncbi:bifunctional Prefoldin beta-like/Prefoldin [Babesia duncani]|uniref:Bifunctional Prefoldin beta-like/Prefoldin n=1 Tax=Babesia duncani TaxID=323732 RepID=A0AAD9PLY9_9APIC|nr:bifunctional Prefoldin beta-like/Prefoldin [Babesia duncani]